MKPETLAGLMPPYPSFKVTPPKKRTSPLEPLDQASWDAMEGKARWDSIVALRGPDLIGSDTLKWFTTSVIRFRLSKIMRVGGLVNSSLGFVVLPSGLITGKLDSKFDATHFLNHVHEAATWLKVPVVWCSKETFAKMIAGDWGARMAILKDIYDAPDISEGIKKLIAPIIGGVVFPTEEGL